MRLGGGRRQHEALHALAEDEQPVPARRQHASYGRFGVPVGSDMKSGQVAAPAGKFEQRIEQRDQAVRRAHYRRDSR